MLGNVIAVIMGVIVGMALYIGIQIYGLFNVQKQESMAFLLCIVAPLLRSFCGCWIAAHLGPSRPMLLAMIVGMISLVGGAVTQVDLMSARYIVGGGIFSFLAILSILLHLGAAWLAGFIEQKRRAVLHTPSPAFAKNAKAE